MKGFEKCFFLDRERTELYPCTIVQDRYSGSYSGARWLAFPLNSSFVPDEIDHGDGPCMNFWLNYKKPVGRGRTPQESYEDLITQAISAGVKVLRE